jgi:hypothetical protein
MTPVIRDAVVACARSWLGVPWRHQGRSRRGIDCAGLVVLVARELGLADHDLAVYGRHSSGLALVDAFRAAMDTVPLPAALPGDVLLLADAAYPCHCGILTELRAVPHLLHAHALRRQVIEEPYLGEWPAKTRLAFRFRGLGD